MVTKVKGRRKLEAEKSFVFLLKMNLWSITRFNLYILGPLILLLLHLLACLNIISWTKFFQIVIGIWLLNLTLDFQFWASFSNSNISSFILLNMCDEAMCFFTTIVIGISSPPFGIGDLLYLTSVTPPSSRPL